MFLGIFDFLPAFIILYVLFFVGNNFKLRHIRSGASEDHYDDSYFSLQLQRTIQEQRAVGGGKKTESVKSSYQGGNRRNNTKR